MRSLLDSVCSNPERVIFICVQCDLIRFHSTHWCVWQTERKHFEWPLQACDAYWNVQEGANIIFEICCTSVVVARSQLKCHLFLEYYKMDSVKASRVEKFSFENICNWTDETIDSSIEKNQARRRKSDGKGGTNNVMQLDGKKWTTDEHFRCEEKDTW